MKNFFQQEPRDKLYERPQDHSSQKQEKEIVCKLRQKDRIGHCADPIDRAQGTAHKPPVNKSFPLRRRCADLAAPARKGIDKETEKKLFSPFFSTKPNGQGIGLIFIREVLQKQNCSFSLRTYTDGLTRFRILFE